MALDPVRAALSARVGREVDGAMISASRMTDEEIALELISLGALWDDFRASDDDGHGGSPGEWMVERMCELETEQKRRSAAAPGKETGR